MTVTATVFKRLVVRDPAGKLWLLVVTDQLDDKHHGLAQDTAETYGRYSLTILAPNGRGTEVLRQANTVHLDHELARYQAEIAAGTWGATLLADAPESAAAR